MTGQFTPRGGADRAELLLDDEGRLDAAFFAVLVVVDLDDLDEGAVREMDLVALGQVAALVFDDADLTACCVDQSIAHAGRLGALGRSERSANRSRHPIVMATRGTGVRAALGPDRENRFTGSGVEHEIKVSIAAAQVFACRHDDDLGSATRARRLDTVARENLLIDSLPVLKIYSSGASLPIALANSFARAPRLLLHQRRPQLAELVGQSTRNVAAFVVAVGPDPRTPARTVSPKAVKVIERRLGLPSRDPWTNAKP